jgi:catechol 2,3-dioxygenase-like lactoylglutathione lyase family enzyme
MIKQARASAMLPAQDLERAKAFYRDKLGMTPAQEGDPMSGLVYELSGGTSFSVFQSSGAASGTHTQLALEVQDMDAAVKDLRARGLKFEEYDSPGLKTVDGIAEIAGTKAAWFKDSEGNLIAVGLPVPAAARKGS